MPARAQRCATMDLAGVHEQGELHTKLFHIHLLKYVYAHVEQVAAVSILAVAISSAQTLSQRLLASLRTEAVVGRPAVALQWPQVAGVLFKAVFLAPVH